MTLFNGMGDDQDLIKLLKKSRVNFSFNKKTVKNNVMSVIEEQQLTKVTEKIQSLRQQSFMRRHMTLVSVMVVIIVVISGTVTVSQAEISVPGDKLHAFEQMQEKWLLNVPMPTIQKLELQTNMVAERNSELQYLLENSSQKPVKAQAIDDSIHNLDSAIEQAWTAKTASIKSGNKEQEQKIEQFFDRLNSLADEQEKHVSDLVKSETDENEKAALATKLETVKKIKSRAKAPELEENKIEQEKHVSPGGIVDGQKIEQVDLKKQP